VVWCSLPDRTGLPREPVSGEVSQCTLATEAVSSCLIFGHNPVRPPLC
jgi:hypothetical protein